MDIMDIIDAKGALGRTHRARSLLEERRALLEQAANLAKGGDDRKIEELSRQLADASDEVLRDREVALAVVSVRGSLLEHFGTELKDDSAVVAEAVRAGGGALRHASDRLRSKKDFVLELVRRDGIVMSEASESLQADREVVLEAVQRAGCVLTFASEELKADAVIVAAAVMNNGFALHFASAELRGDQGIVLLAVRGRGMALMSASEELKLDKDFLILAARISRDLKEAKHCYEQANICVKDAYPWETFSMACKSSLAVRGQRAPLLSVSLTSCDSGFHCQATLLSGTSFSCDLTAAATAPATPATPGTPGTPATPATPAAATAAAGAAAAAAKPESRGDTTGDREARSGTEIDTRAEDEGGGEVGKGRVCGEASWGESRETLLLKDLAEVLVQELPKHATIDYGTHVFITFVKSDDESIPVSVWDWQQPLSKYVRA